MKLTDKDPITAYAINEIEIGQEVQQDVFFSSEDLKLFGELSQDWAPIHFDQKHAKEMGFEENLVHGFLAVSRFSRMLGMYLPGPKSVIQSTQFKYLKPIPMNEVLCFAVRVLTTSPAVNSVVLSLSIDNGSDTLVSGKAICTFPS